VPAAPHLLLSQMSGGVLSSWEVDDINVHFESSTLTGNYGAYQVRAWSGS